MALITIGSTAMPNPYAYNVTRSDLDSENTTRSESGVMLRDRVRAGVYKIEASWKVKRADYKKVVDAVALETFSVTFFDPNSATTKTATMYAGDRVGSLVAYLDETKPSDSVWDLTLSLIEV